MSEVVGDALSDRRAGRRSFGRVVLLGLAAAGLAAVAGHKPWVGVDSADDRAQSLATSALTAGDQIAESPAAGALALVCLACWGVLLVTRRRVRRAVAVLGLLAAVGLVATVVVGFGAVPDDVRRAVGDAGATVSVSRTVWFWLCAVASIGCVGFTALAVRLVPSWPEMGTRYDAPVGAGAEPVATAGPVEEQTNLELWKSIDEGHDPTT